MTSLNDSLFGKMKIRFGTISIGLLLAGMFMWLAVKDVDLHVLKESLRSINKNLVLPFVVILSAFYLLKVKRWRTLIPEYIHSNDTTLATPMMIGFAANNLLPFRVGEVLRIYMAGNMLSAPKSLVLGTIVTEKIFDVIAIALIFVVGLIYTAINTASVGNVSNQVIISLLIILAAILLSVVLKWLVNKDSSSFTKYVPTALQNTICRIQINFASGFSAIKNKRQMTAVLLNSILQWLLLTICIYLSMMAVDISSASFSLATIVLGFLVLGVTLPSAPAFVGSVEYAFVFSLGLFGQDPEQAMAIAIFYHAVSFLWVLLLATLSLVLLWITRNWQLYRL